MPIINFFSFVFSIFVIASPVTATPPSYGEGKATQDKIQYCNKLINRYGHLSYQINDDYYGIGVSRPVKQKWKLKINEPGWFSKKLYVIFEQTTKEKYEDYTHRAFCKWEKDGNWFEFVIGHHSRQGPVICYKYATDREHICP